MSRRTRREGYVIEVDAEVEDATREDSIGFEDGSELAATRGRREARAAGAAALAAAAHARMAKVIALRGPGGRGTERQRRRYVCAALES
jgi:hypothetical protein